jgi:hypothetical protein
MVIYGDAGCGKTTLSLSFPKVFVIDTDGGLISGAIQGMEAVSYEPNGWKEFEALYFWAKERRDRFDTIVFDSITTLQRLLLDEIVDNVGDEKDSRKAIMEFVPEQSMYLANQRQMARILTDFRRLGKHLVVTAGVRQKQTAAGTPVGPRFPDVSPGFMSILNHWSSVIAELVVRDTDQDGKALAEPVRALMTGPSQVRVSKSRFRSLLPLVPAPTYDEIWKRVSGEYEAALARKPKPATTVAQPKPKPEPAKQGA